MSDAVLSDLASQDDHKRDASFFHLALMLFESAVEAGRIGDVTNLSVTVAENEDGQPRRRFHYFVELWHQRVEMRVFAVALIFEKSDEFQWKSRKLVIAPTLQREFACMRVLVKRPNADGVAEPQVSIQYNGEESADGFFLSREALFHGRRRVKNE